jgi:hypothetical protein
VKAIAAKAAKAEAKKMARNKRQRERRHEQKRQQEHTRQETTNDAKSLDPVVEAVQEEVGEWTDLARMSALPKELNEELDRVIQNFQMDWPLESGHNRSGAELEWQEGGDAMEFTIGNGDSSDGKIEVGEEEHCNLWSLLGADDERIPERGPWDLGLELESPDIQRWADEEGWADVIGDAVMYDRGWTGEESEDDGEKGQTRKKSGKLRMRQERTKAPRTIRNVRRGVDLVFHEIEAQTKWPWSLHWSLEDATFKNKLYKSTINGVQKWIASQDRRGYGVGQAER